MTSYFVGLAGSATEAQTRVPDGGVIWAHETQGFIIDVARAPDGSSFVVEASTSGGNATVTRLAADGAVLWTADTGNSARAIALTADGGAVVGSSFGGNHPNLWRFSAGGDVLWSVDTGLSVHGVAITTDGRVVAGGDGNQAPRLQVFSPAGAPLWSADPGAQINAIAATADGGWVVGGHRSAGMTVRRYDRDGTQLWQADAAQRVFGLAATPEGDVFAAGGPFSYSAPNLYRIAGDGTIVWSAIVPSQRLYGIDVDDQGRIWTCGVNGIADNAVFRLNADGDLVGAEPLQGYNGVGIAVPNPQPAFQPGPEDRVSPPLTLVMPAFHWASSLPLQA